MKHGKLCLIVLCLFSGLACRLTSPTPASWSGTPTAQSQAKTETIVAQTAQAFFDDAPTEIPLPELPTEDDSTPTPSPTPALDGPWLVFPDPEGSMLQAYDVDARLSLEIELPQPIQFNDLLSGRSPEGGSLFIRAGSPENFDELALYRVSLPEGEVTRISPLLSLELQRQIINEQSDRALETLQAVTRLDSLRWSPSGRYLAFSAALDNPSSDLYLYDAWGGRVARLNGLYTHNGSPFWAPGSNWLVSQEYDFLPSVDGWKAVNVTAIRVPGYDDQNTLFLPPAESQSEMFLGWVNSQSFLSTSQTTNGLQSVREVNVESVKSNLIFDVTFKEAAFDPGSKFLAVVMDHANALGDGLSAGIYGAQAGSANLQLIRVGDFSSLTWEPGGMFVAGGMNGTFVFPPEGDGLYLPEEEQASLSPNGIWLIAWGEGGSNEAGARLYQPPVGAPLQTLLESPVRAIVWQPDSLGFFILSEGKLFHFNFPGLNPEEVAIGFSEDLPAILAWME